MRESYYSMTVWHLKKSKTFEFEIYLYFFKKVYNLFISSYVYIFYSVLFSHSLLFSTFCSLFFFLSFCVSLSFSLCVLTYNYPLLLQYSSSTRYEQLVSKRAQRIVPNTDPDFYLTIQHLQYNTSHWSTFSYVVQSKYNSVFNL